MSKFSQSPAHKFDYRDSSNRVILPTNFDEIMATAVPIWQVLGLTEDEYNIKFHPKPAQEPVKETIVQCESVREVEISPVKRAVQCLEKTALKKSKAVNKV